MDTPLAVPLSDDDIDTDTRPFTLVTGMRSGRKRQRVSSGTPPDSNKTKQIELAVASNQANRYAQMNQTLYIKGTDCDIVKEIKKIGNIISKLSSR
jgi:hypothetical protein